MNLLYLIRKELHIQDLDVCILYSKYLKSKNTNSLFEYVQMEMRSQDQALVRQLMELHSGIQELKQELSEEEATDEEEGEDEDGASFWDSESEGGSIYCSSAEMASVSFLNMRPTFNSRVLSKRGFSRRSSVP